MHLKTQICSSRKQKRLLVSKQWCYLTPASDLYASKPSWIHFCEDVSVGSFCISICKISTLLMPILDNPPWSYCCPISLYFNVHEVFFWLKLNLRQKRSNYPPGLLIFICISIYYIFGAYSLKFQLPRHSSPNFAF